jgi:mono/diheme cytochrome c family protein
VIPRFWLLLAGCFMVVAAVTRLAAAQPGGGPTSPPGGVTSGTAGGAVPSTGSGATPPAGTGTNGAAAPGVIDGATLFATMCGWCHQDGGRAEGRGPKLAGTDKSDAFIVDRIKTGKAGAMPAFGAAFSDAQLQAIVAYIRGLKTATR